MLTVVGKDRPGIIASVTGILYERGCNLEDVSMTILEGQFAMMLVAHLRSEGVLKRIQLDFQRLKKKGDLTFFWNPLAGTLRRGEQHNRGSISYLVRAVGRDRTGIVYQISRLLARHKLNITDMNCRILGAGGDAIYTLMLEVDVPRRFKIASLRRALEALGKKLRLDLQIRPVETIEF